MRTLITIISDLHVGSSMGLCSMEGMGLDDGGSYHPSAQQQEMWRVWLLFRQHCRTIKAKKRILVINGDIIDGFHHNTVALATNNIAVQEAAAAKILRPLTEDFSRVFVCRGTEAHVQQSAQSDERVAKAIGAEMDDNGNQASWQWWLEVDGLVLNIAHHIGTTSSAAYETSAVMRELVAALTENGQWDQRLPDVFIRSHRHRFIELAIPQTNGKIHALVTPGWQLRSPFVERVDRMRMPHIGGVNLVIEEGSCQIKETIYPFMPSRLKSV